MKLDKDFSAVGCPEIHYALCEHLERVTHDKIDQLTGLQNKQSLVECLQKEIDSACDSDHPVSCALLDVDSLEAQDKELGTVSMDDLLAELAMTLRHNSRANDIIARFDGTLLAAILPDSPIENAVGFARKMISEVDSTTYADPNFPTNAKIHVGLVECCKDNSMAADMVLGEAMRALLQAKSCNDMPIVARQLHT